MKYYVYIVSCGDQTLYTGITTDVDRRIIEHNTDDKKGAKYTKIRRPVRCVYKKAYANRSQACIQEANIKKLSRVEKKLLTKYSDML